MKTSTLLIVATIAMLAMGCRKETCPDPKLQRQHAKDVCTTDCPGVVGCDGRTYCNECEALRHGVRLAE